MIDGINIELAGFDCRLWKNNPNLKFRYYTEEETKEVLGSRKAYFKGLTFTIEPKGKAKISGSIHTFFNNGDNNATRFTYDDFVNAVSQLSQFGVNPKTAILRGFELGLNLDTTACKIDNKTFIDSILYCKGATRCDMMINEKPGFGYIFKTTNTRYKFYDKSEHAKVETSELLRVEAKFTRMRAVENYGIKTLFDLMDKEKLSKLIVDKYLKAIDETIFFEWDLIKSTRKIPTKYKSKFKDLRNPDWWIKDERSRIDRHRNKLLLEKLVKLYAKRNIKNILKDLISLELEAVTRNKNCYEYTEFKSLNNWNKPDNAKKSVTNAQRIVGCDSHDQREGKKKKKYCLICGKEITGQKSDSKYCNDQRICRDKAYNLKVSENRKKKKSDKEKEILKLIKNLGSEFTLTRTTNPNRKKAKGVKARKTSIIVTINGKRKYYHGSQARFFLDEFEKKTENQPEPELCT
ncbi:hypothetical protein [Ancylomarina sp.]|uniref:hypothetical protein n=1 Tax=Ancylomarina sp. TaxID=1970196 RepID=UPI00356A4B81